MEGDRKDQMHRPSGIALAQSNMVVSIFLWHSCLLGSLHWARVSDPSSAQTLRPDTAPRHCTHSPASSARVSRCGGVQASGSHWAWTALPLLLSWDLVTISGNEFLHCHPHNWPSERPTHSVTGSPRGWPSRGGDLFLQCALTGHVLALYSVTVLDRPWTPLN